MENPKQSRVSRPHWLTILALVFLILSLIGWLKMRETLTLWNLLIHTILVPVPELLVVSGAAWGLVGLLASAALFFGWRWADKLTWSATAFFLLTFWVDRLLLVRAVEARANSLFMAGMSILWVLVTFIVLRQTPVQHFLHRQEIK